MDYPPPPPRSPFPLFEGQLKQNSVMCKYVTNSNQNHNKIHWYAVITSFFVLGVKVKLLTNFPTFRRIKLKFGGGVNFDTLISYFMSILPYKMNVMKIKGVYVFFY